MLLEVKKYKVQRSTEKNRPDFWKMGGISTKKIKWKGFQLEKCMPDNITLGSLGGLRLVSLLTRS